MNANDIYNQICGFIPTPEQAEVFDVLSNWNNSQNPLLLRLPCAYGKTESVIVPFLNQAISKKWTLAPRMIYVLPTRALCNQMHDRISKYADNVSLLDEKSYLFCWDEIPGNDSEKLRQFLMQSFNLKWIQAANIEKKDDGKTINISDEKHSISLKRNDEKMKVDLTINDIRYSELLSAKESDKLNIHRKMIIVGIEHGASSFDPLFFADICVTTFDQFLYGYARSKRVGHHFDLPAGAIANSVVVFDEAHLYSPYTHSLMRAMIEILRISRIPTIVMTATMPKTLENDLLRGEGKEPIEFSGKWPDHMANRSISWRQEDWGLLNGETLSNELNNILETNKNKRVLIVANRVDVAQKVAKALEGRKEFITLIHSRFTVEDREQKEGYVCVYFGKEKDNQKPGIIISTQVCEVGLDISCDILITECASADALVQRAGRVARWGGNGEVVIVRPIGNENQLAKWEEAYPYVDKKKEEKSEFDGILKGEFAGLAWEYLKQKAQKNLFTDWSAILDFCNKMDYHTNDIEARGALGQLFDATLYADERPRNLSARGELYCTLGVISEDLLNRVKISQEKETEKRKKGTKKKEKTQQIPYSDLRKYLINISFRYLYNKDTKNLKKYDLNEGKVGDKLDKIKPKPFETYLIDPTEHYNSNLGLILAKMEKPEETEEGASCLIL
ncbi:MAG: CRISPR-associated helicase Cas3' [Candidatus Methanoperedens sp.]|nr:CRISPR-associated helicase Cas3' [Candidatus Methanoperedens sp.]